MKTYIVKNFIKDNILQYTKVVNDFSFNIESVIKQKFLYLNYPINFDTTYENNGKLKMDQF